MTDLLAKRKRLRSVLNLSKLKHTTQFPSLRTIRISGLFVRFFALKHLHATSTWRLENQRSLNLCDFRGAAEPSGDPGRTGPDCCPARVAPGGSASRGTAAHTGAGSGGSPERPAARSGQRCGACRGAVAPLPQPRAVHTPGDGPEQSSPGAASLLHIWHRSLLTHSYSSKYASALHGPSAHMTHSLPSLHAFPAAR